VGWVHVRQLPYSLPTLFATPCPYPRTPRKTRLLSRLLFRRARHHLQHLLHRRPASSLSQHSLQQARRVNVDAQGLLSPVCRWTASRHYDNGILSAAGRPLSRPASAVGLLWSGQLDRSVGATQPLLLVCRPLVHLGVIDTKRGGSASPRRAPCCAATPGCYNSNGSIIFD